MTTTNNTTKFKEFDTAKEFEYSRYEYELSGFNVKYLLYCDFLYVPQTQQRVIAKRPGSEWKSVSRDAYVSLINVYLEKESKQDIYYLLDPRLLRQIETGILRNLLG